MGTENSVRARVSVNVISRLRERERERERLGLFAYFGWVFRSRAGLLRYR